MKIKSSEVSLLKMNLSKINTFESLCAKVKARIGEERGPRKTYSEKEHDFFSFLPNFIFSLIYRVATSLDYYNWLPFCFYKRDGLFSSLIITNLGSLKMDPGYHHLYEWGNCPIFAMVGEIREEAICNNGQVSIEKVLPIRLSFDERIEDGSIAKHGLKAFVDVLEDPEKYIKL